MFAEKKAEHEFLTLLGGKFTNETIQFRLNYLLNWYTRKAQRNKRGYNITRIITYLIPCLITVTGIIAASVEGIWGIYVTTGLSAVLIAVRHIIDHYRFYENWVRYRTTVERLKRHGELYLGHCEPYKKLTEQENDELFISIMEFFAAAELINWENLQTESFQDFKNANKNENNVGSMSSNTNQVTSS